ERPPRPASRDGQPLRSARAPEESSSFHPFQSARFERSGFAGGSGRWLVSALRGASTYLSRSLSGRIRIPSHSRQADRESREYPRHLELRRGGKRTPLDHRGAPRRAIHGASHPVESIRPSAKLTSLQPQGYRSFGGWP